MNKLRIIGVGATLALFGGLTNLGAAEEVERFESENGATKWTQETERLMEESTTVGDLTGKTVRNSEDERLGSVSDLVIKLPSGDIEYAVISSGGVFGIGSTDRLVPYGMLSKSNDGDDFRLNVGSDVWKEVPEFDREATDQFESEGFRDRVKEAIGFDDESDSLTGDETELPSRDDYGHDNAPAMEREDSGQQHDGEQRDGGEHTTMDSNEGGYYLVTDVLGYEVVDSRDENVGRVSDFLVGQDDGKITHVLLSMGGFLTIGDEKFAVSPDQLDFDREEGKVRLPVSKEAFSDEKSEDDENWFDEIFN